MHPHQEELITLLRKLRLEGMARVADGVALDTFLVSRRVDMTSLTTDAWSARLQGVFQGLPEGSVERVLSLHAPSASMLKKGVAPAELANWLLSIRHDLGASDGLLAHLRRNARMLGGVRVRRALASPGQVLAAVEGVDLRLREDEVVADCLDPVPLVKILRCLGTDGLALWAFREKLHRSVDTFDLAITADWDEYKEGIATGLIAVLGRADKGPTTDEYLDAFPRMIDDPTLLSRLFQAFARRISCVDGFSEPTEAPRWLKAMARLQGWAKVDLRRLAYMDGLFASHPDAVLATLLAAVRDLWDRDRATAAFGALALSRAARCMATTNRLNVDLEREEKCRMSLAALEGGDALLRVVDRCRSLPLGLRQERHVWSGLTDPMKAHWIRRTVSAIEGSRALGDGLVAYVLSWSSKETYADIEPLVISLQAEFDRRDLLLELTGLPDHVAATRAEYLLDEFEIHPPPARRR